MTKMIFVRKQQNHNSVLMQCYKNALGVWAETQNGMDYFARNAQLLSEKMAEKLPKTPPFTKNNTLGNGQNPAESVLTKPGSFG